MSNRRVSPVAQAFTATLLLAGLVPLTALAQYRVVGPDGRVTFTDRPPVDANSRVEPARGAGAGSGGGAASSSLPFDLQRIAQQFPVTLFTAKQCSTCGEARNLLRQRGIPFTERTVETEADVRAFAAINRDQSVPTMRIGGQVVSGFEASEWTSYLNTAGYPATSRLPANYQNPAPTPLAGRSPPQGQGQGQAQAPAERANTPDAAPPQPNIARRGGGGPTAAEAPPAAPPNPAGIRF